MRSILIALVGIGLVHILLADDPAKGSFDDIMTSIFNTQKEFVDADNSNGSGAGTGAEMPKKQPVERPTPAATKSDTDKYRSCGLDKECVPRFLCQNDTINTDGTNIIDIRVHGEDCAYLELCCDIVNKRDNPVINPVPPIKHEGCGYRNPDGVGYRIQGGIENEAEFGEFPWMVAILREEDAGAMINYAYEGGGALIAPNVVITAAHCVKNRVPDELIIRVGEWDTQTEAEILPFKDERVSEIIVHEKYNKGSLWNDIAIIILKGAFKWEENIRPICLPPHNANFDYERCYTTGWGKDKFGKDGIYQSILKRVDVPIMPHNQCQTNLRTTRVGKYFQLHESFICAGGERGKDACTGDGGSPLVCPIASSKDRYFHAGIVAWGIGCGEVNIPGVYGNVAYLRPWIDNHLSSRGIDFSYFTP